MAKQVFGVRTYRNGCDPLIQVASHHNMDSVDPTPSVSSTAPAPAEDVIFTSLSVSDAVPLKSSAGGRVSGKAWKVPKTAAV